MDSEELNTNTAIQILILSAAAKGVYEVGAHELAETMVFFIGLMIITRIIAEVWYK